MQTAGRTLVTTTDLRQTATGKKKKRTKRKTAGMMTEVMKKRAPRKTTMEAQAVTAKRPDKRQSNKIKMTRPKRSADLDSLERGDWIR